MSEYNPFDVDNSREPEFMPTRIGMKPKDKDKEPEKTVPARTVDKVISIVYASVLLALQAMTLIFLLCGCVQFNGSGINVVHAFDLIINIFTMTLATVYKSLIGGAMAAVFIVTVVFVVIRLVRSIRLFITLIKGRNSVPFGRRVNSYSLGEMYNKFITSFVNVIIFTVVSNLLGASEITGMTITLTVFGGVVFVAQSVLDYVYNRNTFVIADFILDVVKNVVLYITMAVVVGFLNNAAGKDFLYGAQKMFNGNVFGDSFASTMYSLYVNIIEPALFVAIALLMLVIITDNLRGTVVVESDRRKKVTASIVLVGITMALHLICRVIIASGATSFEISMIGYWLQLISSSYIPLLICGIIMLIISISCGITLGGEKKTEPVASPPQSFVQQI